MIRQRVPLYSSVLLVLCFILSVKLSYEWEQKLTLPPAYRLKGDLPRWNSENSRDQSPWNLLDSKGKIQKSRYAGQAGGRVIIKPIGMDISRAQGSGQYGRKKGASQKVWLKDGVYNAQYEFLNFNSDSISIYFGMNREQYHKYLKNYSYSDTEVANLRSWRDKKRQQAWAKAAKHGNRIAGNKAIAAVETDYQTELRKLLRSRGFALRIGNVVECDMPLIIKRNIELLKPLALSFQKIAKANGYGSEETVGAVLSMAQTAIHYKIPPMTNGEVHTGGILPPAKAILSGWGDCDTKTALTAAILGNWNRIKLVGISVPGHYLMAIRHLPAKGDIFVRYEGLEYVLIEPAGPAWLEPGRVGRTTSALLKGSDGYKIEPFSNKI
ncbi:MAG: hypothetical protein L6420_05565 [Elusimicrobia bacterium]|nr:hypothetical protein [Elusimicrobiota bacterium]